MILAQFFKSDVEFLPRGINKTADIKIGDLRIEIKSPTGSGKRNIQHNLQNALKQSSIIAFDARRSKIHIARIRREVERRLKMTKSMKRLILIEKDGKVVDFQK